MRRILSFLFISIFSVSFLCAEDPQELAEVVVTASRVETTVLEAPGFVTVVAPEEPGISGLMKALESAGGVSVSDYGLSGSVKTVRIRGSNSSQVLVLVDGVRLNSERDGAVDLGLVPTASIDRVEIVRGGGSSVYGSDAIGGVVNIITKKATKTSLSVSVQNGSYIPHEGKKVSESSSEDADANYLNLVDSQKVEIFGTTKIGDAGLTAGGNFLRADNAFAWKDDTYIDDYRQSVNADHLAASGNVGVFLPALGGELSLKGDFSASDKGVPGKLTGYSLSTDARQKDTAASFTGAYINKSFLGYEGMLDVKTFAKYRNLKYENPPYSPSDHGEFDFGVDATHDIALGNLSLVSGFFAQYCTVDSTDIGDKDRTNGALFLSAPLTLAGGSLILTPQVRGDWYSDFGAALSGKLAGVFLASESLSLKTNAAYAFRAPTLNDLFWPDDPANYVSGNPDLKPETAYTFDFGAEMISGGMRGSAAVFMRYTMDEIKWISDPDTWVYKPFNLNRTFIPGFEADFSLGLPYGFSLSGNYTFAWSFLLEDENGNTYELSDDKRNPNLPMHSGGLAVAYEIGGNRVAFSGDLVSSQYTDSANTTELEGHAVFNLEYERTISDSMKASVAVKNLFNTVYENASGYLAPPVSVWVGASLSF